MFIAFSFLENRQTRETGRGRGRAEGEEDFLFKLEGEEDGSGPADIPQKSRGAVRRHRRDLRWPGQMRHFAAHGLGRGDHWGTQREQGTQWPTSPPPLVEA